MSMDTPHDELDSIHEDDDETLDTDTGESEHQQIVARQQQEIQTLWEENNRLRASLQEAMAEKLAQFRRVHEFDLSLKESRAKFDEQLRRAAEEKRVAAELLQQTKAQLAEAETRAKELDQLRLQNEQQVSSLRNLLENRDRAFASLESEYSSLQEHYTQVEAELHAMQERLLERDTLLQDIEGLRKEKQKLERKLADAEAVRQQERTTFENTIKDLEEQKQLNALQLRELEEAHRGIQFQLERQKQKVLEQATNAKDKESFLLFKIAALEQRLQTEEANTLRERTEFVQSLEKSDEDRSAVAIQLTSVSESQAELRASLEALSSKQAELENNLRTYQEWSDGQLRQLSSTFGEVKANREELVNQVQSANASNEQLSEHIEKLDYRIAALTDERRLLQQKNAALENQIKSLQNRLKSEEQQFEEEKAHLIATMTQQQRTLQGECETLRAFKDDLLKQLDGLKKQRGEVQEENNHLNEMLHSMRLDSRWADPIGRARKRDSSKTQ